MTSKNGVAFFGRLRSGRRFARRYANESLQPVEEQRAVNLVQDVEPHLDAVAYRALRALAERSQKIRAVAQNIREVLGTEDTSGRRRATGIGGGFRCRPRC